MSNVIVKIKGNQNFEIINGSCEVTEINLRDRLVVILVNHDKYIIHFKKITTKEHLYPTRLEIKFKGKKESCKLVFEPSYIEGVFPSSVLVDASRYQGGNHVDIIIPLLQFLYEQAIKEKETLYAAEMIRLQYFVKSSEIISLRNRAETLKSILYSCNETSLLSSSLNYECRRINYIDMKNNIISIEDSIAVGHVMKFKSIEIDALESRIKGNASVELNILLESDRMVHLNFPKVSLYRNLNSEFILGIESIIGKEERKGDALAIIDLIEILCEIYDDLTIPDDQFKSSVSKLKEIKKLLEESFIPTDNK